MTSGEPKNGRGETGRWTWSSFMAGIASFFRSTAAPTPTSKAVFLERGAPILAWGWGFFNFSMGATVWVESNELLIASGDNLFGGPLSDIRAVRERAWYMRKKPVVEVVFPSQRLQLGVADPGSLISLLQAPGIATERAMKAKPKK